MKKLLLLFIVATMTLSCSKDSTGGGEIPLNVKEKNITLNVGETTNINAVSSNDITYKSEEPLIAKVDETGKIKARYAGETTIKVSDKQNSVDVNVIVEPKNKIFVEPDFTSTKEELFEKYKTLKIEEKRNDVVILNFGEGDYKYRYFYIFKKETRNIATIVIPYESTAYSIDDITDWLKERYIYIDNKDDKFQYVSPDKERIVSVEVLSRGIKISIIND